MKISNAFWVVIEFLVFILIAVYAGFGYFSFNEITSIYNDTVMINMWLGFAISAVVMTLLVSQSQAIQIYKNMVDKPNKKKRKVNK